MGDDIMFMAGLKFMCAILVVVTLASALVIAYRVYLYFSDRSFERRRNMDAAIARDKQDRTDAILAQQLYPADWLLSLDRNDHQSMFYELKEAETFEKMATAIRMWHLTAWNNETRKEEVDCD